MTCHTSMRLVLWLSAISVVHSFECDAGHALPDDRVNDDYCDCADGTDEPNTGACPNQPFVCPSKPHVAQTVFASRVNDGICDCCDGADEWRSDACPNTCVDAAKDALEIAQRAAVQRAEREANGKSARAERTSKLADARAGLETAAASVAAMKETLARAEELEESRRAERETRLAANEITSALQLAELSTELIGVAIARLALAKQVDGVDTLHGILVAMPTIERPMAEVDAADMIMVAMEAKEESHPTDCTAAASACGHEAELLALLPLAELPTAELMGLVLTFANATDQVSTLPPLVGALLVSTGRALDQAAVTQALSLVAPFADAEADGVRARLAELERTADAAKATIAELEPIAALEGDFGDQQQWYALHKQCYTASLSPFKYRLCPFDTFTQDGRTLGRYVGWQQQQQHTVSAAGGAGSAAASAGGEHERMMLFGDGEACNGVPRKASVRFSCGAEDALQAVSEPSMCVYEATFATPSACATDDLRAKHEELSKAAAEAGLPYEPSATLRGLLGL